MLQAHALLLHDDYQRKSLVRMSHPQVQRSPILSTTFNTIHVTCRVNTGNPRQSRCTPAWRMIVITVFILDKQITTIIPSLATLQPFM